MNLDYTYMHLEISEGNRRESVLRRARQANFRIAEYVQVVIIYFISLSAVSLNAFTCPPGRIYHEMLHIFGSGCTRLMFANPVSPKSEKVGKHRGAYFVVYAIARFLFRAIQRCSAAVFMGGSGHY